MGTYAWNTLYSKILPAKSGAGSADRPPRARPVRPYTGIWLRALSKNEVQRWFRVNPLRRYNPHPWFPLRKAQYTESLDRKTTKHAILIYYILLCLGWFCNPCWRRVPIGSFVVITPPGGGGETTFSLRWFHYKMSSWVPNGVCKWNPHLTPPPPGKRPTFSVRWFQ